MSILVVSPTNELAAELEDEAASQRGAQPSLDSQQQPPVRVETVSSVRELLDRVAPDSTTGSHDELSLILLDLDVEQNLFACKALRQIDSLCDVAIIVVTPRDDAQSVEAAYHAGASDYLPRPFGSTELRGRVRSELALAQERLARADREKRLLAVTASLEQANRSLREREEMLARQLAQGVAFQNALLELATLEEPTFEDLLGRALRVIAQALGIARVGYWELNRSAEPGAATIKCLALYFLEENRFEQGAVLEERSFPKYFQALQSGETIAAEDACTDPRTSEFADVYLRPNRIGAMLDIPVFVRGVLAGVICHEHVGPPRAFRVDERQFAFSVGQVLSLVVETESRRRAEQALRESQAHLETVIDTALDAVITMDEQGRIRGWNRQAELLFGKERDAVIGNELADVALPAIRELINGSHQQTHHDRTRGVRLEIVAKDQVGSDFPVEISIASFALSGTTHFSAFVRDITQRKAYEQALRHSATHDALTGLANRARFVEVLNERVRAPKGAERVALVFLDLDRFKQVNDTLGHNAGDDLLRAVAQRMRGALRTNDLAARFGGDEFTALLDNIGHETEANAIASRLLTSVAEPVQLGTTLYQPSASVGVVLLKSGSGVYPSAEEALHEADTAMYAAKTSGKGRVVVYRL